MSQPRGTFISGWWVWWPMWGDVYARCFSSEKNARAWIPVQKGKYMTGPPSGDKWIMRVGYGSLIDDPMYFGWNHDKPIVIKETEVLEQYRQQQGQEAAA